jgi:hypothetical protein
MSDRNESDAPEALEALFVETVATVLCRRFCMVAPLEIVLEALLEEAVPDSAFGVVLGSGRDCLLCAKRP